MMTLKNVNPFQTTANTLHHYHIWISLHFYISMDYLPTTKVFVQTFFLEKVWLEDTLPTYILDICPKFLWDPLLREDDMLQMTPQDENDRILWRKGSV